MGMYVGDDGAYQSEINVTPLVDVVLVLLIIFMVIMPLTLRGYDVDVPSQAVAPPPPEARDHDPIVLRIDAESCPIAALPGAGGLPDGCDVRIDDDLVSVGDLAASVSTLLRDREPPGRVLFLSAEDDFNYEAALRIIDTARSETPSLTLALID